MPVDDTPKPHELNQTATPNPGPGFEKAPGDGQYRYSPSQTEQGPMPRHDQGYEGLEIAPDAGGGK